MKGIEVRNIYILCGMLINIPLYLLAKVIPRDHNLSVIGSSLGQQFTDNAKYFYIYFHHIRKDQQHQLIWISKNRKVVKLLRSQNMPAEYLYSPKGVWTVLRASRAFLTHQLKDINGPMLGGAKVIQLWHGIPLRKIGFNGDWNDAGLSGQVKLFLYRAMPFNYYMTCHTLIAPSLSAKESYKEAFKLSFESEESYKNIIILGQPRNDALLPDYTFESALFPKVEKLKRYSERYEKIVSWLPTHRSALKTTLIDVIKQSGLEMKILNAFCKRQNILFVIKPHFLEVDVLSKEVDKYDHLLIYDAIDPYPLLNFTDILITDYSSVYFDFLLTQKPILFTPFDYDAYRETVDFYYAYDEVTPGKKCRDWVCIMSEIKTILQGNDSYREARKDFLEQLQLRPNNAQMVYDHFFGSEKDV